MVPLKELGECLVTVGDRDYFSGHHSWLCRASASQQK